MGAGSFGECPAWVRKGELDASPGSFAFVSTAQMKIKYVIVK